MFKKLIAFAASLGLAGCNQSSLLTPLQFTENFVAEIKKSAPQITVTVVRPLELKASAQGANENSVFLDNAYANYKSDPQAGNAIIQKYVAALVETSAHTQAPVDPSRIVPVIKDKTYLGEVRQSVKARGGSPEKFMTVYEEYNSELWIFYAEDSPKNIRYLSDNDLAALKLERNTLRELAVKNLRQLLPEPTLVGTNGLYMMHAGGDYEASLILADSIWQAGTIKVDGDLVIAIPSRDVLLITGSSNHAGLKKVRDLAEKTMKEAPYRLTPDLFVYRRGKFELFRN